MSSESLETLPQNKFNIIAAKDNCHGISRNGMIPWQIPEDLKRFKEITTSNNDKKNVVIMGRKTWETLPKKKLPNRINIVLSTQITHLEIPINELLFAESLENAFDIIKLLDNIGDIFIIGGSRLYKEALTEKWIENCDLIYLTSINFNYRCDNHFPYQDITGKYFYPIETEWCVIDDPTMGKSGKLDYKNVIYKNKELMNDQEFEYVFGYSKSEFDSIIFTD